MKILALSVLDEVTGLALNAVDYQMTAVDAITYTATLAIPDQASSNIAISGAAQRVMIEDTNTDAAIRYRLVHVERAHADRGYGQQLGR